MTAPAIALESLTPEQELYRAEKARRADRVRPEMVAAAAELQRLDALTAEARKAGRPRKTLSLGRPRGRAREPDPEMPGRPDRLELSRPSPVSHHPTEATVAKIIKSCQRSGAEFRAKGPAAKYCGDCPECHAANATKTPVRATKRGSGPTKPPARATKPAKVETPGLAGAIAHIEQEIVGIDEQVEALNAQRERLEGAIESLRAIGGR